MLISFNYEPRWRHLIPLLPKEIPLFVPDLPGYGLSASLQQHDKLTVGSHLISALASLLKNTKSTTGPQPIILIGHDRGARIAHRLSVSSDVITGLGLSLLATAVIDIVPTTAQWAALGNSPRSAVTYWHWPWLATPLAPEMIRRFGPAEFVRATLPHMTGPGAASRPNVESGDAIDVYAAAFEREGNVEAACGDYTAGAFEDADEQKEDQRAGRKVKVPLLVLHGAEYIAKTFDVPKVWSEWVADQGLLSVHCAAKGVGHFVPEEAPEETAQVVTEWLKGLGLLK